jgi:hypothetical protein
MIDPMAVVAGTGVALYVGHHLGDYWVQTDTQAAHKGDAGLTGALHCAHHVVTYVITQAVMLGLLAWVTGWEAPGWTWLALAVSGLTHYAADRREHGLMFRLARLIPGKAKFMMLGVPRAGVQFEAWDACSSCEGQGAGGTAWGPETNGLCWDCRGGGQQPAGRYGDNPSLGTGSWALDQSWHIVLGVFIPALILGAAA